MPRSSRSASLSHSDTLADILERVLETGIVIAGDIRVNLNDVELLTIQIRLIVCSVDKAQEMGMDWWRHAEYLTAGQERRLPTAPDKTSGEAPEEAPEDVSGAPRSRPTDNPATTQRLDALDARLARLEKHITRLGDALDDSDQPSPGEDTAPGEET